LDDDAQELIRTVARRGYLFAAPVTMPTVEFPRGSNETVSTLVPPSQAPTGAPRAVDVDPNEPRTGWRGRRVLRIRAGTQPEHRWKIITVAAIVVASVSFGFKSHLRGWKLWTAVAVALAALAAGFVWQKSRARRISEKDTIVLADFVNTTGDAVFDDALKQGLRVQLEQSPFLNIVSDQKVNEELQLM
jgi:hypothetical protein